MRVLPADVYDTLEFSALAFGGIGAHRWTTADDTPVCGVGHLAFARVIRSELTRTARRFGFREGDSDVAVRRINDRKGLPEDIRVSFPEWCAELGIVRGE